MAIPINFTYPITKPFSRRWAPYMLAFGLVSVAAFVVLNVFLAGYDVITISSTDFNNTVGSKLSLHTTGTNFGCQPHQFQLGDTFRTNISAFSYSIFEVQPATSALSNLDGGFLYSNNVLSSCDVVQYQVVVLPGARQISTSASIQCPPPLNFQAVTSWTVSNHAIIGGLPPSTFSPNTLARAISDGVNNITGEAYLEIYHKLYSTPYLYNIEYNTTQQEVYTVIAVGAPNCDSGTNSCVVPPFTTYNAIGNVDLNILPGPFAIAANESNLYNVINVFYNAVRLDLGHWTTNNIFTNPSAFNTSVTNTGNNIVNAAFREIAGTKGMAYVNYTTPPDADVTTAPAVIQIPYTCNILQRKPAGSFIVSVLSATISMFLAAWGTVVALLAALARRQPGANACYEQTKSAMQYGIASKQPNMMPLMYRSGGSDKTEPEPDYQPEY
ncbi:hypothetical protein B0H19DRAFT_1272013 [Mycena capillaripes]|nr:hypothetical protein B0H19DRAFT_1272013 [Mycena capillaripes]